MRLERVQIEHAIAVLAGEPPSSLSLAPMPLDGEPPATPIELPSLLLERRPDIAAAERRVAAANAEVGVASAAFFPAITLGASGGFEATRLQDWLSWPTRFWSVGPALALTVFDGGARRAAKSAALAAYEKALARIARPCSPPSRTSRTTWRPSACWRRRRPNSPPRSPPHNGPSTSL